MSHQYIHINFESPSMKCVSLDIDVHCNVISLLVACVIAKVKGNMCVK